MKNNYKLLVRNGLQKEGTYNENEFELAVSQILSDINFSRRKSKFVSK